MSRTSTIDSGWRLSQQNILWFQICVNYLHAAQQLQAPEDVAGNVSYFRLCKARKPTGSQFRVQIIAQHFKRNAQVITEEEVIHLVHQGILIIFIGSRQHVQHVHFHLGLPVKPLLVPDNLECNVHSSFEIVRLEAIAEGTFAQGGNDLVSV
jgi:hypothetical protein